LIVYLSAVEAAARAVEAEAENAYNRAVVVSSFLSTVLLKTALMKTRVFFCVVV
jgi:small basic protein|tara:strand:- start:6200 stop:6361 length:162 start_codon:yes stop_codon:yes gene_type:complete